MSKQVLKDILTENNCYYLGTIIDGKRYRGIDPKGSIVAPDFTRHIIYLQDTSVLLHTGGSKQSNIPQKLQEASQSVLDSNWEVVFHEIGDIIGGILDGRMEYLDFLRLPTINEPDPEYLRQIYNSLNIYLEAAGPALAKRIKINTVRDFSWMPIDYRWVQTTVFLRTNKLEVNYQSMLTYLREENNQEIYTNNFAEIDYNHLQNTLKNIELIIRRKIL